jgi:hypothetical protein
MEHNERTGQSTVEEKLRRQSLKHQKNCDKNYSNDAGVFNFLNNQICKVKAPSAPSTSSKKIEVKTQTKAQLNLNNFKIEEDIKKVSRSLEHLRESSKRHSGDSIALKNINRQIALKESELNDLQRSQSEVDKEQRMRKDKSKLTIF